MKKLGGFVEGFILFALGLAMSGLVKSDNYWLYLNPKFKWLTLITGIVLMLLGLIAAVRNRRPNLSRIVVFLVFGSIAGVGYLMPNPTAPAFSSSLTESANANKVESRLTLGGQEFIKINLGELFNISEMEEANEIGEHYVTRGVVKRSPELDEKGQFVLFRVFMWCCFADAVAVGFRVSYDHPHELQDGQWAKVYGKLRQLPSKLPEPNVPVRGITSKALNKVYGIAAHKVEEIDPPPIPFMFEFRKSEPYAY
ncbi:MAG: TIGR03943 family protein [Deltaproteobacteria bacterium]|nr:MAG: TIGR03943 family protein [Deltaproteobacteria bacterium]